MLNDLYVNNIITGINACIYTQGIIYTLMEYKIKNNAFSHAETPKHPFHNLEISTINRICK